MRPLLLILAILALAGYVVYLVVDIPDCRNITDKEECAAEQFCEVEDFYSYEEYNPRTRQYETVDSWGCFYYSW